MTPYILRQDGIILKFHVNEEELNKHVDNILNKWAIDHLIEQANGCKIQAVLMLMARSITGDLILGYSEYEAVRNICVSEGVPRNLPEMIELTYCEVPSVDPLWWEKIDEEEI